MKILFLLSSLEPAGSETYCLSLEQAWGNRHEVHWISPQLHFGQRYLSLPIDKKNLFYGIANVRQVVRYIRTHQIDLVHTHARRAHWVGQWAARFTHIPHVTTIHQPPPVHFSSRFSPCLGDETIAISENVVSHLRQHFAHGIRRLHLIRNGLNLPLYHGAIKPASPMRDIVVMGRMSGNRWRAFVFLLDVLAKYGRQFPPARYHFAGRIAPELAQTVKDRVAKANVESAPSVISVEGFKNDVPSFLAQCDGVIAGGRSAMEALASQRLLLVLGERGLVGYFDPSTHEASLATNFGDHLEEKTFAKDAMFESLRQLLNADPTEGIQGQTFIQQHYNIEPIAASVDAVYNTAKQR